MKDVLEQNFYELLEIDPDTEAGKIKAAIDRARRIWTDESGPSYSLLDTEERAGLLARLQQAEEILLDEARKASYDGGLGITASQSLKKKTANSEGNGAGVAVATSTPSGLDEGSAPATAALADELVGGTAAKAQSIDPPAESVSPAQEHPDPDSFFPSPNDCTGENLKRYREACGVDLAQIAKQTKISRNHLESIEEGAYDLLPAVVYVRGFLRQYCAALGLPAERITAGYLGLMELYKKMQKIG